MRAWLKVRVWGTLIVLDAWANVLWGPDPRIPAAGNPHFTVSERLAEMRALGSKPACIACRWLTWIARNVFRSTTTDHCADAMRGAPWSFPSNG